MYMESFVEYTPGLELVSSPNELENWKQGFCKLKMNKFLAFETDDILTYLLIWSYHAHSQPDAFLVM